MRRAARSSQPNPLEPLVQAARQKASAKPLSFAERVVAWQTVHGRHGMPWQATRDPYRVWLSEVMLQQTQVKTVLRYYERFLERFPNVAALARASSDDVMAAWSGLGYYRRARFAHRCAQAVVTKHAGVFPSDAATLEGLPGIGRSTAAAIAAFCSGERVAILDGNVKRVLTRVLAYEGDVTRSAPLSALWDAAEALLPASTHDDRAAHPQGVMTAHPQGVMTAYTQGVMTAHPQGVMTAYTQGVMDLGAELCLTRAPRCAQCPVASMCDAHAAGNPERYPLAATRAVRGQRESVFVWLQHHGRVGLVKRPSTGVWAELWSLPEWASFDALALSSKQWVGQGDAMPGMNHALTHFNWTLHLRRWCIGAQANPAIVEAIVADVMAAQGASSTNFRWVTPTEALELGLPTPWRVLTRSMQANAAMDATPSSH